MIVQKYSLCPILLTVKFSGPSLLILNVSVSVDNGLPATSIEISFIERLRARREWEQDHTIDMTRTRIVIEREIRQWQMREQEIKMYFVRLFCPN